MRKKSPEIIFILLFLLCSLSLFGQDKLFYPEAYQSAKADTLWGKVIKDPYRWMENIKSKDVEDWLIEEDRFKNKYLGLTNTLGHYLGYYSAYSRVPDIKLGPYYFSLLISYLDNTPELFFKTKSDDELKLLFDPNKNDYSTPVTIENIALSPDNSVISLTIAKNGGDWLSVIFLDMETRELLPDSLNFIKSNSVSWYKKGVLYSRYNVKSTEESFRGIIKNRGLYYHKIGTLQSDDKLIYSYPDTTMDNFQFFPEEGFVALQHFTYRGKRKYNTLSIADLNDSMNFHFKDIVIVPEDSFNFNVLGKQNGQLVVQSNLNAPNGAVYIINPKLYNKLTCIIPPGENQLNSSRIISDKIICEYTNDSLSYLLAFDSTGKMLHYIQIPAGCAFSRISGKTNDSVLFYSFQSFVIPSMMHSWNIKTYKESTCGKTTIFYDYTDFITKKIFYKSKDGTNIPMYLVYKKDLKLDGSHPVILQGYGGFGVKTEPAFNPANILFITNGGIIAVPCLRGEGGYPGWHEKGMRLKKQNTIDDFIAAAEYLISNKYADPKRIAALGGSNGGLVIGAAMLQRPDLFKVVVSISGVFDMMRYHLYNIGYQSIYKEEFGNVKDSSDFKNLLHYSPLQNVKSGVVYPATLLVAGDNDDRVNPFHSFKFLATLQANASGKNPYIIYYQEKAGHNGAGSLAKEGDMWVAVYSFIFRNLKIEDQMYYGFDFH